MQLYTQIVVSNGQTLTWANPARSVDASPVWWCPLRVGPLTNEVSAAGDQADVMTDVKLDVTQYVAVFTFFDGESPAKARATRAVVE